VTIRPALNEDINELLPLLKELFSIEIDFEFMEDRQRAGMKLLLESKNAVILVYEDNRKILGMVTLQVVISTAEGQPSLLVEDLVVKDGNRGRGIGGELLAAAGLWGEERGVSRMQLLADCQNTKGLDFYKKKGWFRTNLICLRKYLGE
jgi:GNAT superfamily N-acetyltransferase